MSLSKAKLDAIITAIHSQNELTGVMVGLYSNNMCTIADRGSMVALPYFERTVIVEEIDDSGEVVSVPNDATDLAHPPATVTNQSRVWSELAGAGLNCGFAVISGIGVLGSAAGEVPTAGASTFLLVVAWVGFATSSVQCLNGIVRTVAAVADPDSDSLARWDQNRIYTVSFLIVDAIGVTAAIVSAPAAIKNLLAVLERRGGLASTQVLSKMGREARAKEIQGALARAKQNPQSAKELDKALGEALSAKTMRRVAAGNSVITARNATAIADVISDETSRRLTRAIIDSLGALSPIDSGLPSDWVGSASGSVNALGGQIIHVVGLDAG